MTEQEYQEHRIKYQVQVMDYHEKQMRRKAIFRIIIGTVLGAIVLYMIRQLFGSTIPAENKDVVYLLVGNATGAFFGTMINFYFGDSEGRIDIPRESSAGSTQTQADESGVMRGK
jgi:membrane protein DedA with SNARE-associated domain